MNEVITRDNAKRQFKDICRDGAFTEELLSKVAARCYDFFKLSFSEEFMIVGSMNNQSPFKKIRLSGIREFEFVGEYVAVIMDSYVMFLDNNTGDIRVNFKANSNFLDKVKYSLRRIFHR